MTREEMKKLVDEKAPKIEENLNDNIGFILIFRDFTDDLTSYSSNMKPEFSIETLRESARRLEERN
jgi:hypothetical protein